MVKCFYLKIKRKAKRFLDVVLCKTKLKRFCDFVVTSLLSDWHITFYIICGTCYDKLYTARWNDNGYLDARTSLPLTPRRPG